MKKILILLLTSLALGAVLLSNAQIIASGPMSNHAFGVCGTDTLQAWGNNSIGQLGNGVQTINICGCDSVPVQTLISEVISIGAGGGFSVAVKNDGTVWTWGYNSSGSLGDSTVTQRSTPAQLNSLSGIIQVSAGMQYSLAVKNDGSVWAWGENFYGQLGVGDTIDRYAPIQVPSLTGIVAVAAGAGTSLALKNDGTVWGWGRGDYCAIGDGTFLQRLTPVQSGSLTGITAISTGWSRSVALKSDGTVWVWGTGPLGNGSNFSNTPVQASITGVTAIATGYTHSLALKNDGTVWAWGVNPYGEFGNGTITNSNVPVQSTPMSGAVAISVGYGFSLARKNDGTIWSWGRNSDGQLGDGTRIERHNPVQALDFCQTVTGVPQEFLSNNEEVLITPTLNTGEFTITFSQSKIEASVLIYNLLGEKVYEVTISGSQTEINLRNLQGGIYFVRVSDGEKVFVNKIVVQK